MIFRLELDSSNKYDIDAGEYATMEEEIIELLTYLNKEGYVIYEYMVARKSSITPLMTRPLSSGFFFRRNLFFFEKNIADYRYEVSAVNDLVGTKVSIEESLLKNNCTLTNDNLEREMLDIFDMHIRIVESASISISTKKWRSFEKVMFFFTIRYIRCVEGRFNYENYLGKY